MTDATLHAILHARLLEVLSELKRHGAPTPATGQCCWGLMKTSSPPSFAARHSVMHLLKRLNFSWVSPAGGWTRRG